MYPVYSVVGVVLKVFLCYAVLFVGIPLFALYPVLDKERWDKRFLVAFMIGHFVIIQIVFLLGFLKLCYAPIFIAVVLGTTIGTRLFLQRKVLPDKVRKGQVLIYRVVHNEYGIVLATKRMCTLLACKISTWWKRTVRPNLPEILAVLGTMAAILVLYGRYPVLRTTFATSDEEVHLYYIQALLGGDIYTRGVYPFGFHNIGAALAMFFGIEPVEFIQAVCLVSVVMIMGMLYIGVRRLFQFRVGVVIALAIYNLSLLFSVGAMRRYQYALPQEYGMIFLCPMLIFLVSYILHKQKRDVILFGMCVSLVLSAHFYTALVAAVCCVAFGLVYLAPMIKERVLVPILVSAILFVGISVTPVAVGRIMGKPWEQAMGWAVGVMNNEDIYAQNVSGQDDAVAVDTEKAEYTDTASRAKAIIKIIEEYFFYSKAGLYIWLVVFAFGVGYAVYVFKRHPTSGIGRVLVALVMLELLFVLLAVAEPLGMPTILDTNRVSIFFAYFSLPFLAAPFEWLGVLSRNCSRRPRRLQGTASIMLIMLLLAQPLLFPQYQRVPEASPVQTRGAMLSTLKIMDTYEPHTWTIISPTQETGMIMGKGYHYELVELVLGQEFWNNEMQIYIPTPYVFVYIEKRPLVYMQTDTSFLSSYEDYINRDVISDTVANEYFTTFEDIEDYYKYERVLLMSRAYYWMAQYQKHYPNSANVYYEDKEIIVYRIRQNEYALHNLALDYGYNSRITI